jgi:hypothetical protein
MAKTMHRIDTEQQGHVQAGIRNRILLDDVVFVGPVEAGIANSATTGGIDRVVGASGQDGPRLLVDEDLLHASWIRHVEPVVTTPGAIGIGQRGDQLLIHLADLLVQRHRREQGIDPGLNRHLRIEPRRRSRGGATLGCVGKHPYRRQHPDSDGAHHLPSSAQTFTQMRIGHDSTSLKDEWTGALSRHSTRSGQTGATDLSARRVMAVRMKPLPALATGSTVVTAVLSVNAHQEPETRDAASAWTTAPLRDGPVSSSRTGGDGADRCRDESIALGQRVWCKPSARARPFRVLAREHTASQR